MDSKGDSLLSRAREGIRHLFWRGSYRPNNNKHNHAKSVELELGQTEGYEKTAQEKFKLDIVEQIVQSRVRQAEDVRETEECDRLRTTQMIGALANDQLHFPRGPYDMKSNTSTRRRNREFVSLY